MGLQKYRADKRGVTLTNGSTPWFCEWIGGPTLSKIENCPVDDIRIKVRTVYITGEPDTYFTVPAAFSLKGKRIKGFVSYDEDGYVFRIYNSSQETVDALLASEPPDPLGEWHGRNE